MSRQAKSKVTNQFAILIENLEPRRLLSATIVNFPDFSDVTHMVGNGFGGNPPVVANRLRLTDGALGEARSAWFDTAVPIDTFRTDFVFRPQAGDPTADGFTFTVQNDSTAAVGTGGADLGYTGIPNSVAVAFNLYNGNNGGSGFGFASDSLTPDTSTDMSPIDLHSGDLFKAIVQYNGTSLSVNVTDLSNKTDVFTDSTTVDLATILGSHTGFIGFTSATGVVGSTQDLMAWTFSGDLAPPTVATPATAVPDPVAAKTSALSVLGADAAGESGLTYTWTTRKAPAGAKAPTFSANASNASKASTVTFFKAGAYRLNCTIANANGVSAISSVLVDVNQTASGIRVTPHAQHVAKGGVINFAANVLDQFNHSMRTQPVITWALASDNPGSIDSSTGVFTASSTLTGHVLISATAGSITGVAGALVTG